jgi:hypothetical protein
MTVMMCERVALSGTCVQISKVTTVVKVMGGSEKVGEVSKGTQSMKYLCNDHLD